MRRKKRLLLAFICIIFLFFLGYQIVTHSSANLELKEKTYDTLAGMSKGTFHKNENTVIYDKDNNKIGEVDSGNYQYVKISDIPLDLQNAYIATEDQHFKTHNGVNYLSTFRAAVSYLFHHGEATKGGSTITQQVIKNNLLSQEQTVSRKILEISIAPELEKKYSKQDIMEFYCNSNYYGNGCYGVQSASKFYFGKDVKDLNPAECAMLAGISNSPNTLNPVADRKAATRKMKIILKQMNECGLLSKKEYKAERHRNIEVTGSSAAVKGINNYMSSYALDCAVKRIMESDGFTFQYLFQDEDSYRAYKGNYKKKYNEISSRILAGGYQIYTSFDSGLQSKAQNIVDQALSGYQETKDGKFLQQAAVVTVDNKTGMITSIVGGRGEHDEFNRGFVMNRQPGSSIKPLLVYGPAINEGIAMPSTIVNDTKVYANGTNSFSPKNAYAGYLGTMPLREAMARSANTVAFQLFKNIGIKEGLQYLEKLNFTTIDPADYGSASLSLGGFTNGVSVAEMAKGYATLANNGTYIDRDCITKITSHGHVFYTQTEKRGREVYTSDTAFMVTDMMEGVLNEGYGTAHGYSIAGQASAAKTGTTNNNRDSWMCGFTPYDTAAVWVGKDDNTKMTDMSLAKTIWKQILEAASTGKETKDFDVPKTIEYRKVGANGELGETVFDRNAIDNSQMSYFRRPSGYDYYSTILSDKAERYQEKKTEADAVEKAKQAVNDFENFQITTLEEARQFKQKFSDTQALVEAVSGSKEKKEFRRKLAKHYKALNKAYKKTWKTRIKEADEQDEKEQEMNAQAAAEDNAISAQKKLHDQRVKYMEWYLDKLETRKYNTTVTQQLLEDAKNCLSNCSSYEEYDSLKRKLDDQEKRISTLPTQIPDSSRNSYDQRPDDAMYPDDQETESSNGQNNSPSSADQSGSSNNQSGSSAATGSNTGNHVLGTN